MILNTEKIVNNNKTVNDISHFTTEQNDHQSKTQLQTKSYHIGTNRISPVNPVSQKINRGILNDRTPPNNQTWFSNTHIGSTNYFLAI